MDENRNLFVLTVDSLRYDHFEAASSELANLIDGVEFTQAVATASATGHSMPALAAGVFGDTSGYEIGTDQTTVAERLASNGYTNYLWSENGVFGPSCNYDRGFETEGGRRGLDWKDKVQHAVISIPSETAYQAAKHGYFTLLKPVLNRLGAVETYYTDASVYHEEVLEQLAAVGDEKEMYWIHYMDVHHPFEPPTEYLRDREFGVQRTSSLAELSSDVILENGVGYDESDIRDIRQCYEACCEYMADELKRFITELEERDHYDPDRDVMVITADHGESFSPDKHDMAGHTPTPAFWDELLRVPLIIGHPEWNRGRVEEQVSLIDVAPTLLRAAGCAVPDSYEGTAADRPQDMVRNATFFSVKSLGGGYAGVRHDGWKLFADRITENRAAEQYKNPDYTRRAVLTTYDRGREEVRHVSERDELSPPRKKRPRDRWNELSDLLTAHRPGLFFDPDVGSVSEGVRQQLAQLGYVDDIET